MKFGNASRIYWELSLRNLIQIHSDLTSFFTMSRSLVFYGTGYLTGSRSNIL